MTFGEFQVAELFIHDRQRKEQYVIAGVHAHYFGHQALRLLDPPLPFGGLTEIAIVIGEGEEHTNMPKLEFWGVTPVFGHGVEHALGLLQNAEAHRQRYGITLRE